MAKHSELYPRDVVPIDVPLKAFEAAKHETYRFLANWFVWQGDLQRLCAICYMQGALDASKVVMNDVRSQEQMTSEV